MSAREATRKVISGARQLDALQSMTVLVVEEAEAHRVQVRGGRRMHGLVVRGAEAQGVMVLGMHRMSPGSFSLAFQLGGWVPNTFRPRLLSSHRGPVQPLAHPLPSAGAAAPSPQVVHHNALPFGYQHHFTPGATPFTASVNLSQPPTHQHAHQHPLQHHPHGPVEATWEPKNTLVRYALKVWLRNCTCVQVCVWRCLGGGCGGCVGGEAIDAGRWSAAAARPPPPLTATPTPTRTNPDVRCRTSPPSRRPPRLQPRRAQQLQPLPQAQARAAAAPAAPPLLPSTSRRWRQQ